MSSLQLSIGIKTESSPQFPPNSSRSSSSIWGKTLSFHITKGVSRVLYLNNNNNNNKRIVVAMISAAFKMNLNEYMVTLEKPLGVRFAVSLDGKIFVHAMKKGGNAEKSRIVMVGDTLKKVSNEAGGALVEIKDFGDTQKMLKEKNGSFSLILERPSSPFPIEELHRTGDLDTLFNRGRVPMVTWSKTILTSNLQGNGNSGFTVFCSKLVTIQGWSYLSGQNGSLNSKTQILTAPINQLVCIFSEEESGDGEWSHGSFPLEEYTKALDRSKGELYYHHSLGMRYSKITEQIYLGSCIQTDADVETLANVLGITAVINFQTASECANWGIDSESINESCRRSNILMINCPVREADAYDLRKKLPFVAGLLLRLLRKRLRVFVTCTNGFDRSPACVIAYLHWMQDTSLHDAYNFVTGLHPCRPNRPAIVWATWDLIALAESGRHEGPATHAVTFVWNGKEGEEVFLVGDFTSNWKEPIRAVHKGGSKHEAEVKLSRGKYRYKYIVGGQWRHSTGSLTESDERGNVNNVITVGDTASVRPSIQQQTKDCAIVKVIERPLSEYERVTLAKAARCITFSICPIRLAPK
ncbi:hypothetical protein GIB67_022745 [Kingdonia uniflora]|uniref:Phosphoglucan phosphatase LSF1, chloroplastic n=1 Tax=Kingdonia uniflora TaxID=39325 RepID=A0A7J7NEW8_9MAGN|nr:hypothetical protein GIB67_022745 [Kingdonia uniflora]